MIKKNIKIMTTNNIEFKNIMSILKISYMESSIEPLIGIYFLLHGDERIEIGYGDGYGECKFPEIDADLFIRTNGTCEEDTNYKSGDLLKYIVYYDIGVRVGATYQIQTLYNNKSRITFIDDDLDTRSIEISRLNKYFKKVENKYTELSTSTDKPYSVPILEKKLKKKNEILRIARIKRKNQREELHKLNLKLQKCISLVEHRKVLDWHIERNKALLAEIESLKQSSKISCNMLHQQKKSHEIVLIEVDAMQKVHKKEIEKLQAIIEYLEKKIK